MKAMVLTQIHNLDHTDEPLQLVDIEKPIPEPGEILIKISTCGICHTELDEIEGRTPPPQFPVILGHQLVGTVIENRETTSLHSIGDRVGVGWIFSACGTCEFCRNDAENLCPDFKATGRDRNGGYAEYTTIPEAFAIPIPASISDTEAAPLLCAGAIGYRSLMLSNLIDGQNLGLMGFGGSAHLVLKMVLHRYPNSRVYVFARSKHERDFSLEIGAAWSGNIDQPPPELLNCIIDTTPVWKPIVHCMSYLKPGGRQLSRLVINAIRKESRDQDFLQKLSYEAHLWMEKEIKSVANVSRRDIIEFLELAAAIPIRPEIQEYQLKKANQGLMDLKNRHIRGSKVLKIG